jgi:hypothetical protein
LSEGIFGEDFSTTRRRNKPMNFYYLSVSDLQLLDDWVDPQPEPTELARILHTNGMDITRPYEMVECNHRNLRNEIVLCNRVEGSERTDFDWRGSGAASLGAFLYSTEDIFLKEEMRRMSRRADAQSDIYTKAGE